MSPDRSYAQPSPDAREVENNEDKVNASEEELARKRADALKENEVGVNDEDRKPVVTSQDEVEDM